MRCLAVGLLMAGMAMWAIGCDAPSDGPEPPPLDDPAQQPEGVPMDQPMPAEPEGWNETEGARSGFGNEPASAASYESTPIGDDAIGASDSSPPPTAPDPLGQPGPGEPGAWEQSEQDMSGIGGEPQMLPEHEQNATDGERVFASPGLPMDDVEEN